MRPSPEEYSDFHNGYISLVPETDIFSALATQSIEFMEFWQSVPESVGDTIHPPYTWTIRDVLGHLVDCERIFGYRFLRIIRGDSTPLPGFEENEYVNRSRETSISISLAELASEFGALRTANLILIRNSSDEAMSRRTIVSDAPLSARATAYIMVGHLRHHDRILRQRLS